jgi:putative ABC transport system permease protein
MRWANRLSVFLRDGMPRDRFEPLLQDLRFAFRQLRRRPGFTAAAVLTVAIGVGPLTVVLSLANSLFVRHAPGIPDSDRLVQIEFVSITARGSMTTASVSYANLADLAAATPSCSGFAGYGGASSFSIAADGVTARRVRGNAVTYRYFDLLDVRLVAGRAFTADDDREPAGSPVTVLGEDLASTLFGSPQAAVGRLLQLNGEAFRVIGVAPRAFRGIEPGDEDAVWITGATLGYARHSPRQFWDRGRQNGAFYTFVGTLAPGATFEQARVELTRATRALADAFPRENEKFRTADVMMAPRPGIPIRSRDRAATLVMLLGGVGALLFLIAAANVANLLIFRGVRRRSEIAVRQALGASRWRLVRAHIVDAIVLGACGGVVGVILAFWTSRLIAGTVLPGLGRFAPSLDWRVLAMAIGIAVMMALFFGVWPAVTASRDRGLVDGLRRTFGAGTVGVRRLRSTLSVAQLAVSLALLIGALLVLATMRNLRAVDVGFDPERVRRW